MKTRSGDSLHREAEGNVNVHLLELKRIAVSLFRAHQRKYTPADSLPRGGVRSLDSSRIRLTHLLYPASSGGAMRLRGIPLSGDASMARLGFTSRSF